MNKVLKKVLILFSIVLIGYGIIKVLVKVLQVVVLIFMIALAEPFEDDIEKIEWYEQMSKERMIENKEWLGEYEFIENVSDDNTIKYSIKTYEDGSKFLYADILITKGDKNSMKIVSRTKIEENTLKFVFYDYSQNSMITEFKNDQCLLSFEKKNNQLLTYWGAITPELEENSLDGQVYFVKLENKNRNYFDIINDRIKMFYNN